jgi:hypothetical protein
MVVVVVVVASLAVVRLVALHIYDLLLQATRSAEGLMGVLAYPRLRRHVMATTTTVAITITITTIFTVT